MTPLSIKADGRLDVLVSVSEAREGALRQEGTPVPKPISLKGLIDTGSDGMVIDASYLKSLDIPSHGYAKLSKADGLAFTRTFDVGLRIPRADDADLFFPVVQCMAFDGLKEQGFDCIIGRDVLSAIQVTVTVPEPEPELGLELYLEPGAAPRESVERVLEGLSRLHIAAGGAGLKFHPDGDFVYVRERVEV